MPFYCEQIFMSCDCTAINKIRHKKKREHSYFYAHAVDKDHAYSVCPHLNTRSGPPGKPRGAQFSQPRLANGTSVLVPNIRPFPVRKRHRKPSLSHH